MAVVVFFNRTTWGIDIYNQKGKWLKYISGSSLPDIFYFRYWAIDANDNMYFDLASKQWQQIVKYKLNLN